MPPGYPNEEFWQATWNVRLKFKRQSRNGDLESLSTVEIFEISIAKIEYRKSEKKGQGPILWGCVFIIAGEKASTERNQGISKKWKVYELNCVPY